MIISRIWLTTLILLVNPERSKKNFAYANPILCINIRIANLPLKFFIFDLKASYDWINRDMFKILDIRLKSQILVNILKVFYTGTTAAIKGSKIF